MRHNGGGQELTTECTLNVEPLRELDRAKEMSLRGHQIT